MILETLEHLKNERPTWCHLLFYFISYVLSMFRTLIYPSSGACDCVDELPHRSFCRLQPAKRTPPKTSRAKISNTQRTENKTTDVVIHQHSRKLLTMDRLMSETCWAHKKWNKIASDIKLVFHSSTITMMHGAINIKDIFPLPSMMWRSLRTLAAQPGTANSSLYYEICLLLSNQLLQSIKLVPTRQTPSFSYENYLLHLRLNSRRNGESSDFDDDEVNTILCVLETCCLCLLQVGCIERS